MSPDVQKQRDEELLRMARWLEDQPFNRSGSDKTDVVNNLWALVESFHGARPVARDADAAVD